MKCGNCGAFQADTTLPFCAQCGKPVAPPEADGRIRTPGRAPSAGTYVHGKSAVFAGLLSILPGVGQFYNGDVKKGAVMLISFLVALMLAAPTGGLFGFVAFLIIVWAVIDAFRVARGRAPLW